MSPSDQEKNNSPGEKDLFLSALEIEDSEKRSIWLKKACGKDEDLYERLEELLAVEATEGIGFLSPNEGRLEEVVAEMGQELQTEMTPMEADQNLSEQIGDTIGRYKLLQKIGEGGGGVVYLSQQTEPVKRRVALKIIKLGMDTREVVARFEAERQALAMMDHPNIAKVFDAGATESGRPYFVMELVKGVPITTFCDENKLGTKERLELFRQVCAAMQHAHQKGIIHRDLKPGNVLVTMMEDRPLPKVIDFGIAKATQQELTEKTLFTQHGHFIGTPAYMSPEQASMTGYDIDTRSDIYSLGVLLYELLAGAPPFDQKSLLSAGYNEMRRIIAEDEPPKPSTRCTETQVQANSGTATGSKPKKFHLNPSSLKGELDWVVMKAIEKNRTRRYETANAFAADIGRYLANEPVQAAAASAVYKFKKFVRRNKAAFGIAAAMVMLLLTGIVTTSWQAVRATEESQRANVESVRATEAEKETKKSLSQVAAEKLRGEQTFSRFDEETGIQALQAGDNARAIAHLARALRSDPDNETARFRLLAAVTYGNQSATISPLPLFETPDDPDIVLITRDSLKLVTASTDGTIRAWDLQNGTPLFEISFGGSVGSLVASPDGRKLVAASEEGHVRLYNLDSGRELGESIKLESKNVPPFLRDKFKDTYLTPLIVFTPDSERFLSIHYSFTEQGAADAEVKVDQMRKKNPALFDSALFGKTGLRNFPPDRSTIQVWRAQDGTITGVKMTTEGCVDSWGIDEAGAWLEVYASNRRALFDLSSGEEILNNEFFRETNEAHKRKTLLYQRQGDSEPLPLRSGWFTWIAGVGDTEFGDPRPREPRLNGLRPRDPRLGDPRYEGRPWNWEEERLPLDLGGRGSQLIYDLKARAFLEGEEEGADQGPFEVWNPNTGERMPANITDWKDSSCFPENLYRMHRVIDTRGLVAALIPNMNRWDAEGLTAELWDLRTGSRLPIPPSVENPLRGEQLLRESKPVMAADSTLVTYGSHVWEVGQAKELAPDLRNLGRIVATPDGDRILAPRLGGGVSMLDRKGTERITFQAAEGRPGQGRPGAVYLEVVGKGRTLLASSAPNSRSLTAWGIHGRAAGPEIHRPRPDRVTEFEGPPTVPIISDDGRKVALFDDSSVWVWDLERGDSSVRELRHPARITCAAFDHRGMRLAGACGDGSVLLWDLESGNVIRSFSKHDQIIDALAFDSADQRLIGFSKDSRLPSLHHPHPMTIVWEVASGEKLKVTKRRPATGEISLKERFLASREDGGFVTLELVNRWEPSNWRRGNGNGRYFIPFLTGSVRDAEGKELPVPDLFLGEAPRSDVVSLSADGRTAAASLADGTVYVWEISTGKLLVTPIPTGVHCQRLALSSRGKMLATVDTEFRVSIWDTESGKPLLLNLPHTTSLKAMAFNRDGTRLTTIDRDQVVRSWHLPTVDTPLDPWFLNLCESTGGRRFNEEGILEEIPFHERLEAARRVAGQQDSESSYLPTARWLVERGLKRKVAPGARITTKENLAALGKYGRGHDVARALETDPANARLMARRALDLGANRRGTWLFERALKEGGAEIDVAMIAAFATVLLQEEDPPEERVDLGQHYLDLAIKRIGHNDLEGWRKVHEAHVLSGNHAKAFRAAQRVVVLDSGSDRAWTTLRRACEELWKNMADTDEAKELRRDAALLLHHYADWGVSHSRKRAGKSPDYWDLMEDPHIFSEAIGELRDRILTKPKNTKTENVALIARGSEWRYFLELPNFRDRPIAPNFDDSKWDKVRGGEDSETKLDMVKAGQRFSDVWLRHEFQVSDREILRTANLHLHHTGDSSVFLNGETLTRTYGRIKVTGRPVHELLREGRNVLVLRLHVVGGRTSFDLDLTANVPTAAEIVRDRIPELQAHLDLDPDFVSLLKNLR